MKTTYTFRYLIGWGLIALILLGGIGFGVWYLLQASVTAQRCPLENNAAWASLDWTSSPVDPDAVARLAEDAQAHHLRYLYPFTTYKMEDGFSQAYVFANKFIAEFRKHNQDIKLIAWVGVPLKQTNGLGIDGSVDLTDSAQRREIINFVQLKLIRQAGFDGVQFNVETTFDHNQGLLTFLTEARRRLGPNVLIGVTGETWAPDGQPIPRGDRAWSASTYRAVASQVDQVAAMLYESRSQSAEEYQTWLDTQVTGISQSIAGTRAELLIGMSVSREVTQGHNPNIENVKNSLTGICQAVNALEPTDQPVSGVAMYASWEVTDEDWAEWDWWIQ